VLFSTKEDKHDLVSSELLRDDILGASTSDKTKKYTEYATSQFKKWLQNNGHSTNFETLPLDTLNSYLEVFYAEVKSLKGEALLNQVWLEYVQGSVVTLIAHRSNVIHI